MIMGQFVILKGSFCKTTQILILKTPNPSHFLSFSHSSPRTQNWRERKEWMKKKKEKNKPWIPLSLTQGISLSLFPLSFSFFPLFFSQRWQPHRHPRIGWWWVISEARRGREWGQNILKTPLTQYLSYPPSFPCKITSKTHVFTHFFSPWIVPAGLLGQPWGGCPGGVPHPPGVVLSSGIWEDVIPKFSRGFDAVSTLESPFSSESDRLLATTKWFLAGI